MRAGALVLLLALLAGCGTAGDAGGAPADEEDPTTQEQTAVPVTMTDLEGRTFVSTEVAGHDLVEGSEVTLSVEEGNLSVSGGCNTMFGAATVEEGLLRWASEPATTLMACADELEAQDRWLQGLLRDGVRAGLADDELVLRSGDLTITLVARDAGEAAADLEGLLGRSWVVVETIADGVVEPVPSGVRPPTLEVAADGAAQLFTGCNSGRTRVTVEGDTLSFEPPATTRMACDEAANAVERRVLAVLDGAADEVNVTDSGVVVVRGDSGLVVELR